MAYAPSVTGSGAQDLTNYLSQLGSGSFISGTQTFDVGLSAFGPAQNYWNDILSGNKAAMETAIAPEKQDILSQYRARRRQLAAGPRGGGTNQAVAESEFAQAGDVASLLQKLRPQAAKETTDIASRISQLGLGESEQGMQQLLAALSAAVGIRGQDFSLGGQLATSVINALI